MGEPAKDASPPATLDKWMEDMEEAGQDEEWDLRQEDEGEDHEESRQAGVADPECWDKERPRVDQEQSLWDRWQP